MTKLGQNIDWLIVVPIIYLQAVSLIVLNAILSTNRVQIDFSYTTQVLAMILGLVVAYLAFRARDVWYRLGFVFYVVTLGLLVAVLFSEETGGASRWLNLGAWQLQPSELAKLALILVQARLLASRSDQLHKPWPLLLSGAYTAVISLLVFLQPDLGTVVIIIGIWLAQLVFSTIPKRTLLLLFGILLLLLPASYPFLADYQKQRIDSFFSPSLDTRADGYNVLQASIAIGSGGLAGKGLDAGSQSQLNFLPAQHTDFIFAVIGEKLGFVGALSVIIAFGVLLMRWTILLTRASGRYVRLVGVGVLAAFGLQFAINTGMNLGLLPVTGVPLPFVSGGGTHVVVELAMVGIALGLFGGRKDALQM